jgi:hypothetical protein
MIRMNNFLLPFALLVLPLLSTAYAQSTSPAFLTYDGSGNSVLAIPGQGTQFDVHTSSTVFNGTRDDQMVLAYNTQPNGVRYNNSEPQIRLALEDNYNDGINQNLEWNIDTVSADLAHNRRWMYLKVNRSSPLTGQWVFSGTYFSLQNYNSATNDVPSEYFTVTNDGIARLTSRSGQPSQIQLNTTDSSGYPGSYACLVFDRGYQAKWIVNNQGGNGDTLSIVGTTAEVASFSQTGVFTSKGQRTAVTTKTSTYTATPSDSEIRVDCTARPVTITLPPANATGQTYRIKKIDATGNPVTVACTGFDTVNGATSITLSAQYNGVTLLDGATGAWDGY